MLVDWCARGRRGLRFTSIVFLVFIAGITRTIQDGPEPVAAPAAATVERGHYLVQAANCISCHTSATGKPFTGGRAFETTYQFLGTIYSSNITPDRETGLGLWTEDEFFRAMRTGIGRDGEHLFPAFPYPEFTKLTTADIKAIYAYLRTVPAVRVRPRENSFWFRQRWAVALWNTLYFTPGEFLPARGESAAWNRGNYLVEALAHCGACHTPRNFLLAERTDARMSGGMILDETEPSKLRDWSAPNLTSAKSGLARWSIDDLQKYLKTGHNRWAGTLGPMNEVIANSLRYLTDTDVAAMALYIKSLAANGESEAITPSSDELQAGQTLYDTHCQECHLSSGRGGLRKAPPVAGSVLVQAKDPSSLINVILYGAQPAADIPTSFYTWEEMPDFGHKMTDAELLQLSNFLRASWGNHGGRVSAAAVAHQR